MNLIASPAPLPTAHPNPARKADIFDFLEPRKPEKAEAEKITVRESSVPSVLAVTMQSADGRSISRKVPANLWCEDSYRGAVLQSMRMLVA